MSDQLLLPSFTQVVQVLPSPAPRKTIEQLYAAHEFAKEIHGDSRRPSGELHIEHDRAVAYSVGGVSTESKSVTAGLLHDVLLVKTIDPILKEREMRRLFGSEVTNLVLGLEDLEPYTTLSGTEDAQGIEKLRRAILNIDDIRPLLIRMADRVQNLVVADAMSREKQIAIAREASEIYAPIANRLGIWTLKWKLEDFSFKYLKPELYNDIRRHLTENRLDQREKIEELVHEINVKLEKAGIKGQVTGRSKHIVSIYRKMQRKDLPIDQIYDILAIRIILDDNDIGQCYQVLGIIHNMWTPIPEEFDDYIANPKPNGYKSLHTAVFDHTGQVAEIQIRTRAMHEDAEKGIAAHWMYKEEGGRFNNEYVRRIDWMRKLLIDLRDDAQDDTPLAQRMINTDDLNKRIYVFTPKGELKELPEGGTPIDFAYQIHTEVGHRCRGALVNGKMASLTHILKQGDKVQIITTKRGGPSRDWMNESLGYTRSGRTRSKIRQWFRIHDRETNIVQGREILERELRHLKLQNVLTLDDIANFFAEELDDFLAKIGFGDIQFSQVTGAIGLLKEQRRKEIEAEQQDEEEKNVRVEPPPTPKQQIGLTIQGLSGLHHSFANCCKPIPPEPVMGYVTRSRGVTIHNRDCEQFKELAKKEPGRVLEVSWGTLGENERYEIPLIVRAFRLPELAENIATTVSGRNIEMVRTKSVTDRRGLTTVYMVVSVRNLTDLNWLKQKLENMSHVIEVERQK